MLLCSTTLQKDARQSLLYGSKSLSYLWAEAKLCLLSSQTLLYMYTGKVGRADRLRLWVRKKWSPTALINGERSSVATDPVQSHREGSEGEHWEWVSKSSDFFPLKDWCFPKAWTVIISLYLLRFASNNKKLSPLARNCFVPFSLVFLINGPAISSSACFPSQT